MAGGSASAAKSSGGGERARRHPLTEGPSALRAHVADAVAANAEAITLRWISGLGLSPSRALPPGSILDDIPNVLRRLALCVRDPSDRQLEESVRLDLGRLADLRRGQGRSIGEVLEEFHVLADLIEQTLEDAIVDAKEPQDPREAVQLIRDVTDSVFRLGRDTAERFQNWSERSYQEQVNVLISYTRMISHELGNRLGAADTALEMLLSDDIRLDEERVRRMLGLIRNSIASGLRTVKDVRVLAQQDRTLSGSDVKRLPLETVIQETVREMRVRATSVGLSLHLSGPLPPVLVDAERLPLVLANLLRNAVDHHDRPGGAGGIRVLVSDDADGIRIAVEDDGPGIDEALRGRIFEPGPRREGRGFGLAIAREAVQQMGGDITLEPRAGRGSVFTFTVPKETNGSTGSG